MPEEKDINVHKTPEFFSPQDRVVEKVDDPATELTEARESIKNQEIQFLGRSEEQVVEEKDYQPEQAVFNVPTAEQAAEHIPQEVAVNKAQEIKEILLDMLNDHSSKLPDTAVVMEDVLEYPELTDPLES